MKLKELQTYQHVKWQNSSKSNFNVAAIDKLRDSALELTLQSDGLVQVKQADHIIYVPLSNVGYLIPADESSKSKSKK